MRRRPKGPSDAGRIGWYQVPGPEVGRDDLQPSPTRSGFSTTVCGRYATPRPPPRERYEHWHLATIFLVLRMHCAQIALFQPNRDEDVNARRDGEQQM